MKETIKNGNGIDKNYINYLLDQEEWIKLDQELKNLARFLFESSFFNVWFLNDFKVVNVVLHRLVFKIIGFLLL
jgi:hypothetical protein